MDLQEFSFPVLKQPSQESRKLPLTAFSTVIDKSSGSEDVEAVALSEKAPRSKVALEKGYSQVDWLRLSTSGADLTGLGGAGVRKDVTLDEVRQHKALPDPWIVLRGKVYNIGSYLKFHPGGAAILLKAAGKDATSLFQKYHPWVNADALLAKCLVGLLAQPGAGAGVEAAPAAAAPGQPVADGA